MHIAPTPVKSVSKQSPLAELAERIRAEHQSAIASIRQGAQHAMIAGELLLEAKRQLKHGDWTKWLEANCCAISDRTAQVYMHLALNRAALEAKPQHAADLSVRKALKAIAGPPKSKDTPKAKASTTYQAAPKRRSRLVPPALNSLLWSDADEETRRKFLDSIGPKAVLDVMPESWWPAIIDRLDREPAIIDRLCREGFFDKENLRALS
jgi:hypothetical protein